MRCEFTVNSAGLHECGLCGYVHPRPVRVPPLVRNCQVKAKLAAKPAGQIGTHIGLMLDAVGITPERVTRVLRAAKIIKPKADCGCEKRKRWLNKIGEKL